MPIYAYRCSDCGFQQDVLQKISDPKLTVCPNCGKETFVKQLTAAGFQLKGSGWYVTDFRDGKKGGSGGEAKKEGADAPAKASDAPAAAPAPSASSSPAPAPAASPAPAPSTPAKPPSSSSS